MFLTIKGMGANLAARALVMFGDHRSYYPSAAAVQCEAGTPPVTMCSGKAKRVRFRRACNKFHRQTMQLFALQAINHHPWSYEYYQKHLNQGRSKPEA
ncbi:MAG: transposase [Bacteroidota bacterium]